MWLGFSCPLCGVLVAGIVEGILLGSIPIAGGVMGGAFLCMSSMWFTLEVLNLVLMVGVGDGETRGEGDSSSAIFGMDREGVLMVLLILRAEVWVVFHVGGVTLYLSTRESVSSSCGVSGRVLGWVDVLGAMGGGVLLGGFIVSVGKLGRRVMTGLSGLYYSLLSGVLVVCVVVWYASV